MKNFLLTAAVIATIPVCASAQTRMTLNEEFTGENCPPCASTNPGFWHLCDTAPNLSKLIHITYMEPIPSSGWYYMRTQALSDARDAYYSVNSAPHDMYDGHTASASSASPGHPYYFSQAEINTEAAIASPFNMTVTNAWNSTYDSVITTVTVNCVTAWTPAGTAYLRTALVQTNNFATPPGTNGETDFENVVQAMYPNALGTSLASITWSSGSTQTFTIRGAVPSWVDKSLAPYMVVWIQDDGNKSIAQAGQGTPLPAVPNDGALTTLTTPGFVCNANGTYTPTHTVTLKNSGANSMTSATIYYKADGATTWATYAWTGTLAPGATTTVTMPTTSITVAGALYHSFIDSVDNVNGYADYNVINNKMGKSFFIESTNGLAMPMTTSFESADLGKFYYTDNNSNNETWGAYNAASGSLGHSGAVAELFNCYSFNVGESEVLTLPVVTTAAASAVDFYVAHIPYTAATPENDKLELVYSTTCGSSWTSLWSMAGTALSTGAAATASFTPTSPSNYKLWSVNINSVPAGAILGFRATSDYGNNIWLDDITVRAGAAVGVTNVNNGSVSVNIFPNPATAQATIEFTTNESNDVSVVITDQLGRVVNTVVNGVVAAGNHSYTVNTAAMASGLYNVTVRTEGGVQTQHLSVVQ